METLKLNNYATLTVNHPASHYGIPVLVCNDGRAYGPSEKTYSPKFDCIFGDTRAAHTVFDYARDNSDNPDIVAFCRLFLGQWPEGPQI